MDNKYLAILSVQNSKGNELRKLFNFISTIESIPELLKLLDKFPKSNYKLEVKPGWKRPKKNPPIPIDQLCLELRDFRFYETITTTFGYMPEYQMVKVTTIPMPAKVFISSFHSDWGESFFELSFDERFPVEISFIKLQKIFKEYDLDLCQSKTPRLWYSHYYIELESADESLIINKRVLEHVWKSKIEKKEL